MTPEVGDGISKSRLERLTDGVFALVMTVLVLEITIPHLSPTEISARVPKQLITLIPMILSCMTSFVILGFFG